MQLYVVDFYDTYEDYQRVLGVYSSEQLARKAISKHIESEWDDPEDMQEHEGDYNIDAYTLDD